MIYYQIEDVDAMFKDLEEMEANDWVAKAVVKEPTKAKRPVNKVTKPKAARKSPSKATTSLKEMMAARRREIKEKENATSAGAMPGLGGKELQVWLWK